MFCGLCSMSPQPAAASPSQAPSGPDLGHELKAALQQGVCRPAPLLPAGSFAGFQGWASELEGLVPAPPSRGEKDSLGWEVCALWGGEQDQDILPHCLRCANPAGARDKPHSSCRQMCGLFSRDSTSTRTLPNPALGPWVRELGARPAPQHLDLPTRFPATMQPQSSVLVAGEGAEQSQGPPKTGTPCSQPLVDLGEGQKTPCTLTPWPLPSALHHSAAWRQQPHRVDGTWTLQLLLGAPPAFWGAQPGWGEFCWGWGNC